MAAHDLLQRIADHIEKVLVGRDNDPIQIKLDHGL
jgi:hypothetical protein